VVKVSADVIQDERTGERYYRTEIMLDEAAKDALSDLSLLPGMPVEAFIRTEERSPISYLVRPFADYFYRAFRET
jgi:HlyD family secretion protein